MSWLKSIEDFLGFDGSFGMDNKAGATYSLGNFGDALGGLAGSMLGKSSDGKSSGLGNLVPVLGAVSQWDLGRKAQATAEENAKAMQKYYNDQMALQNKYYNLAESEKAAQDQKEALAQDAFTGGFNRGGLAGLYVPYGTEEQNV